MRAESIRHSLMPSFEHAVNDPFHMARIPKRRLQEVFRSARALAIPIWARSNERVVSNVMSPANRSSYRVVIPLNGFTKKTLAEAVIPAGSRVEWQPGDYAGGLAHIHWRGREFLVIESELFKQCERALGHSGRPRDSRNEQGSTPEAPGDASPPARR